MSANRTQLSLTAADGTHLSAQRWAPVGAGKAALLVIPGYADHGERYRELAITLAERGIDTTALDLRGHGRSSGQRGYVDRYSEYHSDVEAALAAVAAAHPGLAHFVLGHSNGGLVALDWVATKKRDIRGLIVTNPFLDIAMKVSRVKLGIGHVAARLAPRLALPSGIDASGLSHDAAIVEAYERDPLVFQTATAGWFKASREAQARVRALTRIDVPLLYARSDSDPIASPEASAALVEQLESPDKTVILRVGERHEILNEVKRAELIAQIADWILAHV